MPSNTSSTESSPAHSASSRRPGVSKVYLETKIPSYLTARTSRDLVIAAHQELTAEWWSVHRNRFDLYISELVLDEAGSGDAETAARRLGEPPRRMPMRSRLLGSNTANPLSLSNEWRTSYSELR